MSKRLNSTARLKLNVRFWHKADIRERLEFAHV